MSSFILITHTNMSDLEGIENILCSEYPQSPASHVTSHFTLLYSTQQVTTVKQRTSATTSYTPIHYVSIHHPTLIQCPVGLRDDHTLIHTRSILALQQTGPKYTLYLVYACIIEEPLGRGTRWIHLPTRWRG